MFKTGMWVCNIPDIRKGMKKSSRLEARQAKQSIDLPMTAPQAAWGKCGVAVEVRMVSCSLLEAKEMAQVQCKALTMIGPHIGGGCMGWGGVGSGERASKDCKMGKEGCSVREASNASP